MRRPRTMIGDPMSATRRWSRRKLAEYQESPVLFRDHIPREWKIRGEGRVGVENI